MVNDWWRCLISSELAVNAAWVMIDYAYWWMQDIDGWWCWLSTFINHHEPLIFLTSYNNGCLCFLMIDADDHQQQLYQAAAVQRGRPLKAVLGGVTNFVCTHSPKSPYWWWDFRVSQSPNYAGDGSAPWNSYDPSTNSLTDWQTKHCLLFNHKALPKLLACDNRILAMAVPSMVLWWIRSGILAQVLH